MKTASVCVLVFLAIIVTLCHCEEEASDPDKKEVQTEVDAEPAESQDTVYRTQPLLDGTTYSDEDQPRRRYRGNGKRRRRQRKRLRTTTPPFIEEYSSHQVEPLAEQDDVPAEREDIVYERRRPGKRRRRPLRRPQPFESKRQESHDEGEQYPIVARSGPRRRRKGQRRKRIRVKPHTNYEDGNNTQEEHKTSLEQTTPQTEQEMTMDTYTSDDTLIQSEQKVEDIQETMVTIIPGSLFTPSEISEINYKLEPVSKNSFNDQDYTLSEQSSDTKSNTDESILYTTIPVKFDIEETHSVNTTLNDSLEITTASTTTKMVEDQQTLEPFRNEILKIQPKPNVFINNIESIIKSRKSLFSISRRLPPTSAVIRRRLRPRLQKNSTDIETNGRIISPTHLNTDRKLCKDGNCVKELLPMIKNDVLVMPNNLLPAGFMTLPEILSPKQLLSKLQSQVNLELVSTTVQPFKETSSTTTYPIPTTESTTTYSTTSTTTETLTLPSTTTESMTLKETQTNTENLTEETTKTENLKFDDTDLPNLNDGILDLLKTENGKSRLNRILELRNMTLKELLDHRERGSSQRHLSDIFTHNKETNKSKTHGNLNTNETELEFPTDTDKKFNLNTNETELEFPTDTDQNLNNSDVLNVIHDSLIGSDKAISNRGFDLNLNLDELLQTSKTNYDSETDTTDKVPQQEKSKSLKFDLEDNVKPLKIEGTVIPVPILEPTHISMIQFPDDSILGAFPKFITDTLKSNRESHNPTLEKKSSGHHETINKPKIHLSDDDKREPRIFDSMPKFNAGRQTPEQRNLRFSSDWRMLINKGPEPNFPRIGDELFFHTSTPSSTTGDIVDDIVLLDENDDGHRRNHILGGKISAESGETFDEDYTDYKRLPTGVKSAIFASIAIFGLAILGFLSVLVSCRIRQRNTRLRKRNDILCEHLHDDLRSSQNSLSPVLKKVQSVNSGHHFGQGIHSNTSSNRHYYLWRTLRKTFQYE